MDPSGSAGDFSTCGQEEKMARYGRDFGGWNRGYDMNYGSGEYTGQGGWGGDYFGGGYGTGFGNRGYRGGGYGMNRGYDMNQGYGYGAGRGYYGSPYGGGAYGQGSNYRGWGAGRQGGWTGGGYDRHLGDRLREGWSDFRRGVRRTFSGYDRGW
jgi:CspA family cold shock protein